MHLLENKFSIVSAEIIYDNPEFKGDFGDKLGLDEKIFHRDTDKLTYSMNDIFQGVTNQIPDWSTLSPDKPPVPKSITINYSNPDSRFFLLSGDSKGYVNQLKLVVNLGVVSKKIPVSKISQYGNDEKTFSAVIEFDGIPLPESQILQFIRNPDGSISLSAREKNKD